MKAAIYTRVSTQEQAREGLSLAEQERQCRVRAIQQGYEDVKVFTDPGYSGKSMDRPGIQALIRYAPDVIIVWKLDRISRKARQFFQFIEEYKIISVTEDFDTTSISGALLVKMMGLLAEHEWETTRERAMMGQVRARREGRPPGKVPFGYQRMDDGTVKPHPENFAKLQRIFKLRNQGKSGYSIAKEVGVPHNTVYKILKSKAYGNRTSVQTSGWSKGSPKYTLTGVCICPECGRRLNTKTPWKRLKCSRQGCSFTISYLKAWEQVIAVIEAMLGDETMDDPGDDSREVELLTNIADVEAQIARITDAYTRGIIDIEELAYHRKDLDAKLETYNGALEEERSRQRDETQKAGALKYIDIFREKYNQGDIAFVNGFLRILFPEGFTPFSKAPSKGGVKCSPKPGLGDILPLLREMAAPGQSQGPPTQG